VRPLQVAVEAEHAKHAQDVDRQQLPGRRVAGYTFGKDRHLGGVPEEEFGVAQKLQPQRQEDDKGNGARHYQSQQRIGSVPPPPIRVAPQQPDHIRQQHERDKAPGRVVPDAQPGQHAAGEEGKERGEAIRTPTVREGRGRSEGRGARGLNVQL
jgi:hypothetical protein